MGGPVGPPTISHRLVRIGILISTRGVVIQSARCPPVEDCWAMARHADRAGYDAVWVGDSVVAKPRLEPVGWGLPSAALEWAACGADHKRRARRLALCIRFAGDDQQAQLERFTAEVLPALGR